MRLPLLVVLLFATTTAASEIAVTFDDLPFVPMRTSRPELTRKLAASLKTRRIPAVGFVNGDKLLVRGKIDPQRVALLRVWLDAGFELGNHAFAHKDLHRIPVAEFLDDVARGDEPLRTRLRLEPRFFRHPFLHTGRSAADRQKVETFLRSRGYRIAPVTIDNSDWIFAVAYQKADAAMRQRVAAEYVRYMVSKVAYYERQSEKLFARRIPQVLLVHANTLNADHFGTLADALKAKGHTFIALDAALGDSAYSSPDSYYGPAGISWLDRWALTRGVPKGFFADEPVTPKWILELAEIDQE
jgi:peptidoglycan/xylan/chitin deacetylase (PgdA/CDA1 family)